MPTERLKQDDGRVAGLMAGLAHEIRNPLHAIKLNVHTLQRATQRGCTFSLQEMNSILQQSCREIDHIELVLRRLLEFAVAEPPRNQLVDLVDETRALVDFLGEKMRHSSINITLTQPSDTILVRLDPGRLHQILLNLLQNAEEAMDDGGDLHIAIGRRGDEVEIVVADNGPGISPENLGRVFEPFFTTKSTGTGLGLALVKRYVEELQGEIGCESNTEGGAAFRIRLPAGGDIAHGGDRS